MFFCKKSSGNTAELEKQNKIMQSALEFYADVKSWDNASQCS